MCGTLTAVKFFWEKNPVIFGFYSCLLKVTDPRVIFDDFHEKARQSLIIRGLFPMLADPRHPVRTHLRFLNLFTGQNYMTKLILMLWFL